MGLQDERVLVEDDYNDYPDFVTLCETTHGYPATSLQWQPASGHAWSQNSSSTELLATTGDALRVYEYASDVAAPVSSYVGRQPSTSGHSLSMKTALSGVSLVCFSPVMKSNDISPRYEAIQSPDSINGRAVNELLMERKGPKSHCNIIYRHDMYRVEHRDLNSHHPTDSSRPRGLRRCMASRIYGHLRFCWG